MAKKQENDKIFSVCATGRHSDENRNGRRISQVNIKMDMYENGLSDRLQAPTSELITVPAIIEDNDNLPMVACGTDQTVLSGQSIIGGVNSVSLAA